MFKRTELYCKDIEKYKNAYSDVIKSLEGSRMLITGGAGLIGTFLADMLQGEGVKVCIADNCKERLNDRFGNTDALRVSADVCDAEAMHALFAEFKPDYVIHAASNTSPADYASKPIQTAETNVIGTSILLKECVKSGAKRFLFCSSVEAYGQALDGDDVFTEDYSGYVDCNTVRAGYPSAKRASEAICCAYLAQENMDFVTARIGRIYGPTVIPTDEKAPTQFIRDASFGRDIVLKSAGTQIFSYGYVGDCAGALLLILTKGETGNAYNVSDSGAVHMLRDFASFAADAAGTKLLFTDDFDLAKGGYSKVTKAVLDTTKLESLGFKAITDTASGVRQTVKFLQTCTEENI